MFQHQPGLSHPIDAVRRHVEMFAKSERACLYLDEFRDCARTVDANNRTHSFTRYVTYVHTLGDSLPGLCAIPDHGALPFSPPPLRLQQRRLRILFSHTILDATTPRLVALCLDRPRPGLTWRDAARACDRAR